MRRLGDRAFYSLIRLWAFVSQNRPDGALGHYSVEDIEIAADWQGEPGLFVKTLLDLRFLDEGQTGFLVHDWKDHNEYASYADARSEKARKAAQARWALPDDAIGNPKQCSEQCSSPSPIPSPAPDPTPSSLFPSDSDEMRLSKLLFLLMQKNDPRSKEPDFQKWAKEIDRLIRLDKRTPDEVERVIRFSQIDSFWLANIRSAKTLRNQFSQLFLKMSSQKKTRGKEDERLNEKDYGTGTPADQIKWLAQDLPTARRI